MFANRTPRKPASAPVDYWMSYSDLMAGLILVFILLLVFFIARSMREVEAQQSELAAQEVTLEAQQRLLEQNEKKLATIDTDVARVLGVREAILERVKARFAKSGGQISFDDTTGAIRLGSNILFKEGSSKLSAEGKASLAQVMPMYFDALLGDPVLREHVDQIVFEGHTNSNYSDGDDPAKAYLFNLDLSQRRAYAAMEYIIEGDIGSSYDAKELLAAIGYSSSRIIYEDAAKTLEDKEKSRRIEIRFRLKDEESLNALKKMFDRLEASDHERKR